jgi:hypothetical protein
MNRSRFTIINADVVLSSGAENTVIDIRSNIIELSFFESLHKEYVDARIVMLDDFGFRTELSTTGTERINIVVADGNDPNDAKISKTFFFSEVNDVEKTNERSEILSIDLVEEHVYVNAMKCISRSYEGTLEDAIIDISARDLGKDVLKTSKFLGSAQGQRKFIIPYMSPLETIKWLKDRMTTRTGSPIYISADLYNNDLVFTSLDELLRTDVVNESLPLRYTDAMASAEGEEEFKKIYYQINHFEETDTEDALGLYEEGAIGSLYSTLDAHTGQRFDTHISVREIIQDFYTNELISESTSQNIYDPSLIIGGKPSDEYDAIAIHQVTSSNTFNQFKSYHDETQLIDGTTLYESRLKVKNKIIRQILKKNMIDIEMDGALFIEGKISPGARLRLIFLNPNSSSDSKDQTKSIDSKRSGDYLLMNTAHNMLDESHTVSARLVKLGDLPSVTL